MNKINFAIPTYHRPDKIKTVNWLLSLGVDASDIYVSLQCQEDLESYELPEGVNILYREGSGVSHNRNTLLQHFNSGEYVLMLDDDIWGLKKLTYVEQKKKSILVALSNEDVLKFFDSCFELCEENNAACWGVDIVENNLFMKNQVWVNNVIYGFMMGIIKPEFLEFDTEMPFNEDVEMVFKINSMGYNCMRFDGYYPTMVKQGKSTSGGCKEIYDTVDQNYWQTYVHNKYPDVSHIVKSGRVKMNKGVAQRLTYVRKSILW